ncbi:Gluconate transport-inducing protein [Umbelopsis sp. WA50703]
METYFGHIKSPHDALIVFEACRRGLFHRIQRRLAEKERVHIRSGSVFAWDEREAGMRRWTDGRTWSPSRVSGSFLTYRELDTRCRRRATSQGSSDDEKPTSKASSACSYKHDGLIKQSFSICTATGQKLHLISYYTKPDILTGRIRTPSSDPALKHIVVPKGLYPEVNPLDTHPTTIPMYPMRQNSSSSDVAMMESAPMPIDSHGPTAHHAQPPPPQHMISSSPPSLSASPFTSEDEELNEIHTPNSSMSFSRTPSYERKPSEPHRFAAFKAPDVLEEPHHHYALPVADIPWGRLPSSEDERQLKILEQQFRI